MTEREGSAKYQKTREQSKLLTNRKGNIVGRYRTVDFPSMDPYKTETMLD
jgi:hypothetical protein